MKALVLGATGAASMVRLAKSGVRTTRIISLQEIIGAGSEGEDS